MTAGYYQAEIVVALESPFLSAGLAARSFGIDAAALVDAEGHPLLPAGLVRGVLRHALSKLGPRGAAVLALFGAEGDEREGTGAIRFRDCRAESKGGKQDVTRIAIDEDTGTAREGALLVIELSHPIGEEVAFRGNLAFPAQDEGKAVEIVATLNEALRLVVAVGAYKTVGFGRVLRQATRVERPKITKAFTPATPKKEGRNFTFSFALDGPLLLDSDYPEQNVLRGASRISGAALKGALARRLVDAGLGNRSSGLVEGRLGEALSKAIFGFADAEVPPPPLSLLQLYGKDSKARLWDASAGEPPDGWIIGGKVPAFTPDWKHADWAEGAQPPGPSLPFETRTRLAIDADRGAADEGKLFTQQFIPADAKRLWTARISWPESIGKPPPEFYSLLAHLEAGLFSIGRLKAGTCKERLEVLPATAAAAPVGEARIALVLATPHLMLRAADLADEASLVSAVKTYFTLASGGAWTLACSAEGDPLLFARQELRGGFQAARFKPFGERVLEPFVLMQAGSVFVLERGGATKSDPDAVLRLWQEEGLPDPQWEAVALDHRNCPFLQANGFGAVRIAKPGTLATAEPAP